MVSKIVPDSAKAGLSVQSDQRSPIAYPQPPLSMAAGMEARSSTCWLDLSSRRKQPEHPIDHKLPTRVVASPVTGRRSREPICAADRSLFT